MRAATEENGDIDDSGAGAGAEGGEGDEEREDDIEENSDNNERSGGDWKNETVRCPAQNFHAAACLDEVICLLSAKRHGKIDAQLFKTLFRREVSYSERRSCAKFGGSTVFLLGGSETCLCSPTLTCRAPKFRISNLN